MGWDLYSRKNDSYFRATSYGWSQLAGALEVLGADIHRMASYNEGDYVPAKVAASWAASIERGIDSLEQSVIDDPDIALGDARNVVPVGLSKRELAKVLREVYGVEGSFLKNHGLLRTEPLEKDMKKFLLDFARFCRKSKGFEQW
jgi:hypothetical protein